MEKRIIVIGLVFLFLFSSILPISIGQDINLSNKNQISNLNRGNTLYVGGSGPNNYTKIQDAIDDANNGDTVFVYDDESPYYEHIIIEKSIYLTGENRETTVIDAQRESWVINILAGRVSISGFTIMDSCLIVYPWGSYAGVNIRNNYATIINNIIKNNYYGISTEHISGSYGHIISDNIITLNSEDGILLKSSKDSIISNNSILNNQNGIWIFGSDYNTVYGNNISINYYVGITIHDSYNNTVSRNVLSNNFRFGVYIVDSGMNEIVNNNFKGFKKSALFWATYGKNKWDGNYWNRLRITPYFIFGSTIINFIGGNWLIPCFEIDWHPAKEPYDI